MIRALLERLGLVRVAMPDIAPPPFRRSEYEEFMAAQRRASEAFERDPSAAGAIDAVMRYGLNWTQLFVAREAVRKLVETAEAVEAAEPESAEYYLRRQELRTAVAVAKDLRS